MATPVKYVCAVLAAVLSAPALAQGAAMILNEYNAVADPRYLDGPDYSDALSPIQEDSYFRTIKGMPDGRMEGNGGDWLELVVITDHLNIQGWQLRWADTDANNTTGGDIWFGDSNTEQGIIMFSSSAAIWSDLRKGTIITISERSAVGVDTDWDGADRNFTDNVPPGDVDVTIPLQTDTSYNPIPSDPDAANADWWIHVSTSYEHAGGAYLVYTDANVVGYEPGDFSVSGDDWQLTIVDDSGAVIFGPIGEDIPGFGGSAVNDREAGRLEADPSGGVGNGGFFDATSTTFGQPNEWGLQVQNFYDLRIPEPMSVLLLAAGVPLALKRNRGRR